MRINTEGGAPHPILPEENSAKETDIETQTHTQSTPLFEENNSKLTFHPFDWKTIKTDSFVDLCSLDVDYRALTMMAMIQDGQLALISGMNKSLVDAMLSVRSKASTGQHSIASLDLSPKLIFSKLWINQNKKLCVQYHSQNNAELKKAQLDIIPQVTNQSLLDDDQSLQVSVRLTPLAFQTKNAELSLAHGSVEVTVDNDQKHLIIDDGETLKLPLRKDEWITSVKTCANTLQMSTFQKGINRVYYLDARHLNQVTTKNLPIMTDEPPIVFSHFSTNNSHSFFSANPFVSHKVKNIHTPQMPLSGLMNSVKHRVISGTEKRERGRTGAAIASYLKAVDPGLITIGRYFNRILTRFHSSQSTQNIIADLEKEIDAEAIYSASFENILCTNHCDRDILHSSDLIAHALTDSLKVNQQLIPTPTDAEDTPQTEKAMERAIDETMDETMDKNLIDALAITEEGAQKGATAESLRQKLKTQINASYAGLKSIVGLFDQPIEQKKEEAVFRKQWSLTNKKLISLLTDPNFKKKFIGSEEEALLIEMKTLTDQALLQGCGTLAPKEIELLFPFVSQTLFNTKAYLNIDPSEASDYERLEQKINANGSGLLMQYITQRLLSYEAVKHAHKAQNALNQSLQDKHVGLGKLWMKSNDNIKASADFLKELANRVEHLQEGDNITFSTSIGLLGASPSLFGEASSTGFKANLSLKYHHKHDLSLSRKKDNIQFEFVQKHDKSVKLSARAGISIKSTDQIIDMGEETSSLHLDPLKAVMAVKIMQETGHNFFFEIHRGDTEKILKCLFNQQKWDEDLNQKIVTPEYSTNLGQIAQIDMKLSSQLSNKFTLKSSPNLFMPLPNAPKTILMGSQLKAAVKVNDQYKLTIGAERAGIKDTLSMQTKVEAAVTLPSRNLLDGGFDEPDGAKWQPPEDAEVEPSSHLTSACKHAETIDDPEAIDQVDAELKYKRILEAQRQGTASADLLLQQLITHLPTESEKSIIASLLSAKQQIDDSKTCPQEIKDKLNDLLSECAKAIDKGHLSTTQEILGEKIGQVIIYQDAQMTWHQQIENNFRQLFSIPTKHTTTLEQFLADHEAGSLMLKFIKDSSKSQTSRTNLGRSSALKACVNHSIDKTQLLEICQQFIERKNEAFKGEPTKEKFASLIQHLETKLTNDPNNPETLFQLKTIDFRRESLFKRSPPTLLPHLTLQLGSSIKLTERLGRLVFEYENVNTDAKNPLPKNIINQTEGALASVIHPCRVRLRHV